MIRYINWQPMLDMMNRYSWTHKSFCRASGVSYPTLRTWLNFEKVPTMSSLTKVCEILRCNPSKLFKFTDYEVQKGYEDRKDIHVNKDGKLTWTYSPLWDYMEKKIVEEKSEIADIYTLLGADTEHFPERQYIMPISLEKNVTVDTIHDICKFLKVSPDWVVRMKPEHIEGIY